MQKYNPPKWKYHAVKDAVLVKDSIEEQNLGSGWSDAYIEKKYPKFKYRPAKDKDGKDIYESKIARSKEHEEELGKHWHDSPASFGIETTPGLEADKEIAAKKPESKKSESKKSEAA